MLNSDVQFGLRSAYANNLTVACSVKTYKPSLVRIDERNFELSW